MHLPNVPVLSNWPSIYVQLVADVARTQSHNLKTAALEHKVHVMRWRATGASHQCPRSHTGAGKHILEKKKQQIAPLCKHAVFSPARGRRGLPA